MAEVQRVWCGPLLRCSVTATHAKGMSRRPGDRPRRLRLIARTERRAERPVVRADLSIDAERRAIGRPQQAVHRKQDERAEHGENGVDRRERA